MSQKYAILGLLNISPMTGYTIKKNLEGPMKGFWPISYGGLYPALHRLAEEKLVDVHNQDGNRGQILYSITEEGKKELQRWLKKINSTIECKDEFMLKIFLSKDLSDKERVQLLKEYLYQKTQLLDEINVYLEMKDSGKLYYDKGIDLVTRFALLSLKNEISILKEFIEGEDSDD